MPKQLRTLILIVVLAVVATLIALPKSLPWQFEVGGRTFSGQLGSPVINTTLFGQPIQHEFTLKQGLDIQGGMQVILGADMSGLPEADRVEALTSAQEIIARRVDLYGISEPVIQTSQYGDQFRLLVELPGVDDPAQALQLVGTTASLDFRLEGTQSAQPPELATVSAVLLDNFQPTGLTGAQLRRASLQFDPQTGAPVVGLEFTPEGAQLFGDITSNNIGKILGIFIDDVPIMFPTINTAIINGQAVIQGAFSADEAKQLAIQLNAGALPVPITVLEQRTIGASLGQDSVQKSVQAGLVGIGLVIVFMILCYGSKGVLAGVALALYAVLTIAVYKIIGITLTLPGLAGLVLSVGMAVDSNILIFERIKEELRMGKPFNQALELGFGRAWNSIKDANIATILTALILINPLNFPFLNTSGLVRGFGLTLLIGILIGLFTGIVVSRTLLRVFLKESSRETHHD